MNGLQRGQIVFASIVVGWSTFNPNKGGRRTEAGPWTWAAEAYVYGRAGQQAQARHAVQKLEETNRRLHLDPAPMFALAYAGMNDRDEALAWLQKAYAARSNALNAPKVDPVYDTLRDDPRFQELMRRIGLSP